jgi:hypothetical protein
MLLIYTSLSSAPRASFWNADKQRSLSEVVYAGRSQTATVIPTINNYKCTQAVPKGHFWRRAVAWAAETQHSVSNEKYVETQSSSRSWQSLMSPTNFPPLTAHNNSQPCIKQKHAVRLILSQINPIHTLSPVSLRPNLIRIHLSSNLTLSEVSLPFNISDRKSVYFSPFHHQFSKHNA